MGRIWSKVKKNADLGMQGRNSGLYMGFERMGDLVNHLQKSTYYVVAGKTSAGKTAFTDQAFVMEPFEHYLKLKQTEDIKVDWLYFSLEISPENKFAKFGARQIEHMYGMKSSMAEILSLGKNSLSPEKRAIMDSLDEFYDEFEKVFHIYDMYDTPGRIYKKIKEFYAQHGKLIETGGRKLYTPNHPNHYVFIVIDTINLLGQDEDQRNLKEAIDQCSKDMIKVRNIYGGTPIVCQQYNANIVDPKRMQMKMFDPIVDDLEDSKRPSKDCNTYFSVFDPSEMGLKVSMQGYNVEVIKNNFRTSKST